MNKLFFASAALVLAASTQAATVKQAGIMSDYLFRGISQTNHDIGVYVKATNTNKNAYSSIRFININASEEAEGVPVEMDVNFGYNMQFDDFNIDLEVITYNYLVDTRSDETEFKIGTSLNNVLDINLYRGIKRNTWYPELVLEKYLSNRLYLDASAGVWLKDDVDDIGITGHVELGRDFPELYGIDIYVGASAISDSTPFGGEYDQDEEDINYLFGLRKNF
ncbi:TorF family putative porin [Reinekea thalattae]|uniref:TIGR04219 family outer membrane beta-barrel protein n=1 Tax=Reinekea thalattae TaxID=2593301 RepID=A0A5C8Z3J3_9GAMM|nr:TorF family putative porin [Reinekea thalattae]TXR51829.1 hypothetical protein FME95_10375 [Reinekea thalattae]